jgi:UDP-N-acetylglucosamine 2-epimerase (non-hydrolysing)
VKIATVVGARPQFVKCAPLSKALRASHQEVLIHTGQHYDYEMSKVFFEELEIPEPDYNLSVGSGSHGAQTGKALAAIEQVLMQEAPDLVLVYGDTNSTLAGALAAAKLGIRVAHVEAGLRSYDRAMPEEVNRVLTDHISDVLFAPTRVAVENLRQEGVSKGVHRAGDVMVDSLALARGAAGTPSPAIEALGLRKGDYLAMTMHRPQNTDDPARLRAILGAMARAGRTVVFPAHPRTRKALQQAGMLGSVPGNIRLIEPLGYVDMVRLMMGARAVVTDSGGIQKETYLLGVRCVTMRDSTEWPETLAGGMNVLVGADPGRIVQAITDQGRPRRPRGHPFGAPGASRRIAAVLGGLEG